MSNDKPNVIFILVDDMGFSDLGCYGGEIDTPNLDKLGYEGLRFSQFYSCAKCSPSRATLLTGMYPHQAGMGLLASRPGTDIVEDPPDGYVGDLSHDCATIAETLKQNNYVTYLSGKWHLSNNIYEEDETWPRNRGFDFHYGNISGATSYFYPQRMFREGEDVEDEALEDPDFYYTDAISDQACDYIQMHDDNHDKEKPFFMYVAYTCPHWPMHAKQEDIDKYKGRFDEGWDELRENRIERLRKMGMMNPNWDLGKKGIREPDWEEVEDDEEYVKWLLRRMEVYAAMIDNMDQGVGRIIDSLKTTGHYENTIIFFMSDNGASPEEINDKSKVWAEKGVIYPKCRDGSDINFGVNPNIMPGPENTFQSYGLPWANLSNTPFRGYKSQVHEGGISAPFLVHWPGKLEKGGIRHQMAHLIDLVPTTLELIGIQHPDKIDGREVKPLEGTSLKSVILENDPINRKKLGWEQQGNKSLRDDKWKLVKRYKQDWELYDLVVDRTENNDLADQEKDRVKKMVKTHKEWEERLGVLPYQEVQNIYREAINNAREDN